MEQSFEHSFAAKIDPRQEAYNIILQCQHQAHVMGANDYEPSAFESLKNRLATGKITPDEAISEARYIIDSKQDYH